MSSVQCPVCTGQARNEGGYAYAYAAVYGYSPDTSGRIYSDTEKYELQGLGGDLTSEGNRTHPRREMAMVRERKTCAAQYSSLLAPCKVARREDICS